MVPLQGDAPEALSSYATLQRTYHPDSSACALQAGTRNFAGKDAGPQLPDAVVDCILSRVALPTRLFTCATVCKAWAAAAVRPTTIVHFIVKRYTQELQLPLLQTVTYSPQRIG
jgi:hypothetical protein